MTTACGGIHFPSGDGLRVSDWRIQHLLAAWRHKRGSAAVSGSVMSSVYADIDGQGGIEAIKMAIADMVTPTSTAAS